MLLLLFACLALHPIYDLHLHAVDIQKQASVIVANQDQPYFWLTEKDIEEVLHEYCLSHNGKIEKIVGDTKTSPKSPVVEDGTIDTIKKKKKETSSTSKETVSEKKTTVLSPQTIYQDDILTQSTYLCFTTHELSKEKEDNDLKKELEEELEEELEDNNLQIQDHHIQYDDRSYIRIHAIGKERKRIHLVSVANDDVHAFPMSSKTMKDPLLDSKLQEQERKRIFDYRYIGDPSKLSEISPLPFGYQITDQTSSGLTLERIYIERVNDISPKIAVFKRIEIVNVQLQPNIHLSQTTTHIFRSDVYGRQVEEIEFQDLRQLQLWLTEIMIQHPSLFSNKVEQDNKDTETEEDDSNTPNKEENQNESP